MDTFISLDVETTGLSFELDRVIQFGCSIFIKGSSRHNTSFYINNTDVPNAGFHVNQITDEQIKSGLDPEYALCIISSIIHKQPRCILAYNAPFDLMMLANEFQRYGIVYDFARLRIIDPLVIARKFYPPFYRHRLINACDRYRVSYNNTHDAGDDSEAAGHVFAAQRIRHGIRGDTLSLHKREARWHREWADSFKMWAHQKGREVDITPWPYHPDMESYTQGEQSLLW